MKPNQKQSQGFTLIELLVVVAIISLLSSIALIGLQSARQKSRDAKRLGDMTQMNTALELYFNHNKGYPSSTNGVPNDMSPGFVAHMPSAPVPADGVCETLVHPVGVGDPVPAGVAGNTYFYIPTGTPYTMNIGGANKTLYPDYAYYFCLGNTTGNFSPGMHYVTPKGLK